LLLYYNITQTCSMANLFTATAKPKLITKSKMGLQPKLVKFSGKTAKITRGKKKCEIRIQTKEELPSAGD